MFKWFKFGVAGITSILIIIGVIIGIAFTVVFNLYVEKQKKMTEVISSEKPVESLDDFQVDDKPKSNKKIAAVEPGILTKENFDRLEKGISYKEAVKILGAEGKKDSERISEGSHSITYRFAEDNYRGYDISTSFLNDELSQKSFSFYTMQESEVPITAEDFDKLKPGMNYKEVTKIIGGEGVLVSDYGFPDADYHSLTYTYTGTKADSTASLTFNQGELSSKSQHSLE